MWQMHIFALHCSDAGQQASLRAAQPLNPSRSHGPSRTQIRINLEVTDSLLTRMTDSDNSQARAHRPCRSIGGPGLRARLGSDRRVGYILVCSIRVGP